jgi:hypothetical protein
MPRSGEQAGRRGPREASSEVEAYARGRNPLAERELTQGAKALNRDGDALKGRHALERGGGGFAVRCPPLERDGGSPEGYHVWQFDGSLRLFGSWASFALVGAGEICVCA